MAKKESSGKTVTRIKASDEKPTSKQTTGREVSKSTKRNKDESSARRNPATATGGYFKGAWYELSQVHWPTRRATWGLTGAVLAFSAFFVVLILLLDAGFKLLFDQLLK